MSSFGAKGLTNKGRVLQAKAQAGAKLTYTKYVLGDAQLGGQSIATLNGVISPKKSVDVTRLWMNPPNQAIVGFVLSNQDVTTGFYFRELGLYALDPDEGEILYWYANAGDTADYIPATNTGDVINKTIDMYIYVGTASNVTLTIDQNLAYVTHDELAAALEGLDPDIPGASLTQPGIVQLSNATNGTRENVAPTEKALKAAYDRGSEGVTAAAAAQSKANAAETPAGAQAKANAAETNAKSYVDAKPWQKHKVSADDGTAIDISGQNLDNILLTGFYKGSSMINAPALSGSWGYVEVIRHAETWVLQKVYDLHADRFFMRRRTDSGWTAWTQDLFTSVANGKLSIANAINDKSPGQWTPATATFDEMAAAIRQIPVGKEYYEGYLGTIAASGFLNFDTGFRARIITVASSHSPADQSSVPTTTVQVLPYGGSPGAAPIASSSNGGYMSIRKGDGSPFLIGDVADGKFLTTSFRVSNAQTAPWYNILVRAWA